MGIQIGDINLFKSGQILSMKALVSNVQPKKDVIKKATKQVISLQECQLSDTTGSIKLTLWEDFVNKCETGKTYNFANLGLKNDLGQKSHTTTQNGCTISETEPFPGLEAPKELPTNTSQSRMEIFAVSQISSYNACSICAKKVQDHPTQQSLVKCATCQLTMKKQKCNPVLC